MKILWFSNTPANGSEVLNDGAVGGGWLESLDRKIQNEVDLHIAFYYPKDKRRFRHLRTTYYPITAKNWRVNIVREKLFRRVIDRDDLYIYLDIINEVKPDLIHIHGTENPFGCIQGEVDIPIVVSIQGNITVYHHKFFSGIEKEFAGLRPKSNSLVKYLLATRYVDNYEKLGKMRKRELRNLQRTKYIIGRTDWDRRIMSIMAPHAAYFQGEEMLREDFYRRQWKPKKNSDRLIIHTTNGNSLYKGFETLCASLTQLNDLGVPVEWRVAGIRPYDPIVDTVKHKLKSDYPNVGLNLVGRLSGEELVQHLLEADLYVMPSHIENSPNNLCEAMILGVPCIATFAGGTGSLLNDRKEGILVQDGDPWAMAGAILELYRDPELAQRYGERARERALARHNREGIIANQIAIYKQVVEKESEKKRIQGIAVN